MSRRPTHTSARRRSLAATRPASLATSLNLGTRELCRCQLRVHCSVLLNPAQSSTHSSRAPNTLTAPIRPTARVHRSIAWLQDVMSTPGHKPFMAYIAPKAPHVPSQPAHWYTTEFDEPSLDRYYKTPNFNVSAPDHHWVVAQQGPLTDPQVKEIDDLFRNRWRTLLSVDDLIDDVIAVVDAHGELKNTYFFSTSDHGYNLGQLRLAGNKLHAYENDLRIPMVIRGPGIKAGSTFSGFGSNADVGPTFLGLAGVTDPLMDGRSIAPWVVDPADPHVSSATQAHISNLVNNGATAPQFHYAEYNSLGIWDMDGHMIDHALYHTFRAVRFDDEEMGNILYAEYTSLSDWDYVNASEYKFQEFFDLDTDPWEMHNVIKDVSPAKRQKLEGLVRSLFACKGSTCQRSLN
eukprot:m.187013 g.187013  ORF g.187013 m.187013 type:complete len:405 (-) comp18150_c1_seq6:22-1236(-)